MEEQEILRIIQLVASRLAPKYVFGHYDKEDIEQEAILMGYDALTRWDKVRPLENFIYTHINNRLKTFKRDRYYRINAGTAEGIQQAKKNIIDAISLENVSPVKEERTSTYSNIKEYISESIPLKYKKDYMRMCAGVKIPKKAKTTIIQVIKDIVEKYNENR